MTTPAFTFLVGQTAIAIPGGYVFNSDSKVLGTGTELSELGWVSMIDEMNQPYVVLEASFPGSSTDVSEVIYWAKECDDSSDLNALLELKPEGVEFEAFYKNMSEVDVTNSYPGLNFTKMTEIVDSKHRN